MYQILMLCFLFYSLVHVDHVVASFSQAILSPFQFFVQNDTPQEDADGTEKNETSEQLEEKNVTKDASVVQEEQSLPLEDKATAQEQPVFNTELPVSETINDLGNNTIELDLDNADLSTLVHQMSTLFGITFISDDILEPILPEAKAIKGNKITFKTNRPLSKEETWNVFLSLMDLARFSVIPYNEAEKIYKISPFDKAKKTALRTYIDVGSEALPENDELVRYVCFVENANPESLLPVIDAIRSPASDRVFLKNHKAFIFTDRAYNIKMLLKIIEELDAENPPEELAVIKLRFAEAKQVVELYQMLVPKDDATRFSARKQPTALYFPENVKLFAEPRLNYVFLVGARDSIEKVEEFITKHIDIPSEQEYAPFFIYRLKYAEAETIADILTNMAQFGKDTDVGKAGGIRGNDRYFQPLIFVAEKETNSVIIKGKYEDYLLIRDVINKLDEPQPQISVQFLIVTVDIEDNKKLGAQIRTKFPGPGVLGQNVQFQTSGLYNSSTIVQNQTATVGVQRLLGNLLNLINGATTGTTVVSLGSDQFGVWGIFEVLQTLTNTEVVSNPFFVATNKTPTSLSIGEERRIVTATVAGSDRTLDSRGADRAVLEIKATPQINSDGKVGMALDININDFLDAADPNSARKSIKHVQTNLVLADGEVQVVSGFIRNKTTYAQSKVPIIGDLPFAGWLFKNKSKQVTDQHLLILVSASIIDASDPTKIDLATDNRVAQYHGVLDAMKDAHSRKDPIHRMFFAGQSEAENIVEDYLFERNKKSKQRQRMRAQRAQVQKQGEAA